MNDGAAEKSQFSLAKSIGFRPGPEFRGEVETLARESAWTITDIARVGLMAFWPDIKALVRSSGPKAPKRADEISELREFIELCRSAQSRGVDPKKALADALEAQLTADSSAPSTA